VNESDKAFTGSIPVVYDRYLGTLLFEPYAADVARRVAGLEGSVLEIAAGTGIVTAALTRALSPDARLVATDLNRAMLDHAASKLADGRVTWREADATALPFEDASFDAVVCQFGVMFFPDKIRAHGEARRVLRRGGRWIFSVWDSLRANPIAETVHDAVAALYSSDPPGFLGRTPYGYHDRAAIEEAARAAGFHRVTSETVTMRSRAPDARSIAIGFCQGCPLTAEINARGTPSLS
jgi:SAM-dependent methyltransferase